MNFKTSLFLFTYGVLIKIPFVNKFQVRPDEGYSLEVSSFGIKDIVNLTSLDVHPPFYYLLLSVIRDINNAEYFIRLSSILMFSLTLVVIVKIAISKFDLSKRGILALVLLYSTNPVLHRYAFDIRMYSLIMLLATLVYLLVHHKEKTFVNYSQNNSGNLKYISILFILTIGYYTHYFFFLIPIIIILYSIFNYRDNLKIISCTCISILLFLPWAPIMVKQIKRGDGLSWLPNSDLSTFVLWLPRMIYTTDSFTINSILVLIILSMVIGVVSSFEYIKKIRYELLVLFISLTPLFISIYKPIYHERYLIFCIPILLILLVVWLDRIPKYLYIAILGFLISLQLTGVRSISSEKLSGAREVCNFISNRGPDIEVVSNHVYSALNYQYYCEKKIRIIAKSKNIDSLAYTIVKDKEQLLVDSVPAVYNELWFIHREGQIDKSVFNNNYNIVEDYKFGNSVLYKLIQKQ